MAIELISKIKPKNNGNFKLVDVEDIEYNGKGLDEAIQSGEFKGEKGDPGKDGAPGPKGSDGKSAYQIAVDGGFKGSEQDWLASLKGEKGEPGQDGTDGTPGQDGATGPKGDNGKSTYQIAVDGGFKGSEQEWLASLKGEKGDPGQDGAIGPKGDQGEPGQDGQDGATGPKGDPGKSAYDYAVEGGYQGTEEEFAKSVAGEYSDAIMNTATGDLLVIKDSSDRKVKSFEMTGKTEQVQTTGANLFNALTITEKHWLNTENGNIEPVSTFWTSDFIEVEEGDYCLTEKGTNRNCGYDEGKNFVKALLASKGKITVTSDIKFIRVSGVYETIKHTNFMINRGSTTKPYEPYTGGKPSPSPEYPQEILNAGRLNEDTGKYEVDVKVNGKNLLPNTRIPDKTENGITMKYKANGVYHLSGTSTNRFDSYILNLSDISLPPGKYGFLTGKNVKSQIVVTQKNTGQDIWYGYEFTINTGDKIKYWYCTIVSGKIVDEDIYVYMERNTGNTLTVKDFEPPREPQTITLSLDRPLTKWDRLEKKEGIWGIVRQGETKVLKAAPEEEWAEWEDKQNAFFIMNDKIIKEGLCSHFEVKGTFEIGKETGIYLSETIHLIVTDMNINSLENWKTWLQANPITVTYKTAEEIWEPLPEETQKALNTLHTNYPTTIVANSEDIHMELSYTADTKNYVDGKIKDSISAQIQNTANLLSLMPDDVQAAMIENDTNNILESEVVQ